MTTQTTDRTAVLERYRSGVADVEPLGGTLLGDGPIGDAPTALAVADTARTETLPETRLD